MSVAGPRAAPADRAAGQPGNPAAQTVRTGCAVRLSDVSKVYGRGAQAVLALDRISLSAAPGEFVCLLGASGCGKSTLLALVTGLDQVSAGTVEVPGRSTLMFQEPALFPWLTAARNVQLGSRASAVSAKRRRERADELLAAVHLAGLGGKRPHELSGGMRQRVALARALAQDVEVLALDEPFGALDAMTRDLLHDELERIWLERGLTVLFVTHNVREAVRLGDKVVLLSSRPGTVIEEYPVDIPRPRLIDSPQVSGLAAKITERLRGEVLRHGG
ncbi:MAG TPA: ABC transporter ATP-binding protein [Streptosporangiaceae bacterium]|nr:ABC transporter ATP-binding protein [Streptosporangiaceae bacterium]